MRIYCTAGGCDKQGKSGGLCDMHDKRLRRHGSLAIPNANVWDTIPPPGPWSSRGACRSQPLVTFFPPPIIGRARYDDRRYVAAKAICAECPVLAECREYAVAIPALRGLWGGLTETGRQRARQRR